MTKTRTIAEKAIQSGLTPLEVILQAMRLHVEANEWDLAAGFAQLAAPYVHPRLAAVEHSGSVSRGLDEIIPGRLDELRALLADERDRRLDS